VGPEVKEELLKRLVSRCLLKGSFGRLFDATKKYLDNAVSRASNTNLASILNNERRFSLKLIDGYQQPVLFCERKLILC
jgi:hypothetical protein